MSKATVITETHYCQNCECVTVFSGNKSFTNDLGDAFLFCVGGMFGKGCGVAMVEGWEPQDLADWR